MANKENLPPSPAFTLPATHGLSPSTRPSLSRQRDHSSCRRPDTPLKVRKTRENLKDSYNITMPTCSHGTSICNPPGLNNAHHGNADATSYDTSISTFPMYTAVDEKHVPLPPPPPDQRMQRHKSVSRRMLSKVKQGIRNRSQSSHSIRPVESDTSLVRKLSHKRKQSSETERRAHSFEACRDALDTGSTRGGCTESEHAVVAKSRSCTTSAVATRQLLDVVAPTTPKLPSQSLIRTETASWLSACSQSTPTPATARPSRKRLPNTPVDVANVKLQIPHVELKLTVDTPSLDAESEADVWVAIAVTTSCDNTTGTRGPDACESIRQHGRITSLRISFKPGLNCQITETLGQRSAQDLDVDQTCSLFVKVHIQPVTKSPPSPHTSQASLFTELESIVGTLETDLVHAEVRYRHSLLPHDNVVTVRRTAKIRRPKNGSRWGLADPDVQRETSTIVRQDLAAHIVSQYAPERALQLLDRCLGIHDDTVNEIRQTLIGNAHQEVDSLSSGDSHRPAVVITDSDPNIMTSAQSTEHGTTISASSSSSSSSEEHPSPSEAQQDDTARKLWRHLRHSSLTSQHQLMETSPETLQHLESESKVLKDLRRQAIANKRSVGAETLRAWKWEEKVGYGDSGSTVAPWL